MSRHLARRLPKASLGFSWARFPTVDGSAVTWRLYRRDHSRRIHQHALTFFATSDRRAIAARLSIARRCLRDKVDEIDLTALGLTA